MPGLSVCNRCIPQISSRVASSGADESAYFRSMTSKPRHCTRRSSSTTEGDETTKNPSDAFWRSWECLSSKSKLNKYENKLKIGPNKTTRISFGTKGKEHLETALRTLKLNFRKEVSSNLENSEIKEVLSEATSSSKDSIGPTKVNKVEIIAASSSRDISPDKNYSNKTSDSKGAVPKNRHKSSDFPISSSSEEESYSESLSTIEGSKF